MSLGRSNRKRIAAIVPNVLGFSPGQRVRIELWASKLIKAGWDVEFFPFEDDALHRVLYSGGGTYLKAGSLLRCFKNQFSKIHKLDADVIFIYREASLIGPAILERLALRRKVPIIYDIDDPVFLPYKSPANNWASLLKFSRKTHSIFRLSDKIISINELIAGYARQFNRDVTVIPNCIDTEVYFPADDSFRATGSVK
jgi:glycosyltransferase involved in cell wall biosynthesis